MTDRASHTDPSGDLFCPACGEHRSEHDYRCDDGFGPGEHLWGCDIDHDLDAVECVTSDELRDEAALARAEEMADELGGWRFVR